MTVFFTLEALCPGKFEAMINDSGYSSEKKHLLFWTHKLCDYCDIAFAERYLLSLKEKEA